MNTDPDALDRALTWQDVFREALCRLVTDGELRSLRDAVARDDPRLRQRVTVLPMPRDEAAHLAPTACCVLAWIAWQGRGIDTVVDVERVFADLCRDINLLMGQPGACRHLTSYWDETPRDVARAGLVAECDRELSRREASRDPAR